MATRVQFRRGNTVQNDAFTGAPGELTVNTSNNSIRVHDDGTQGGYELLRADLTNLSVPLPAGQPAGNTTEIQYNIGGVFTAEAGFTFNPTTNLLTTPNLALTGTVQSNLNPNLDLTYSLGNLTNRWSELFVGNVAANAILTDTFEATGNAIFSGNMFVAGNMTVAGSTFGGDDSTVTGNLQVTGNITAPFANIDVANIGTLNVDNLVVANLAATKLINGNSNVIVVPNAEVTISSNGVANIIRVDETGTRFEQVSNFAGNVILNQHTRVSSLANLFIPGGLPNQAIVTDGLGNLTWANAGGGGGISGGFANGTTEGMIPVADGNINFTVDGTPEILVLTSTGANFGGTADFVGNITAQDGIQATGNIGAFNLIADSKVITVDFEANGNVLLGNVANIEILGGSNGQVLQTDGAGNLFWVAIPSGQGFANGTSGGNIPVAGGNINFTVGGIANVVTLSQTLIDLDADTDINGTANIAGEILGAGNANIAINANIGSNLSVGGWANITGNVVAGNVVTTGDVTAVNGIYSGNVSVAANLSALNGTFTNNVTAVNTTLTGNIKANAGNITTDLWVGGNTTTIGTSFSAAANITGNVTSGNVVTGIVTANSGVYSGNLSADVLNIASNVNALNGNFTGNVTAADANISGNIKANTGNILADFRVGGNSTTVGTTFAAAANIAGNVNSGNVITGNVTANAGTFAGNVSATNVNTANVNATNINAANGTFTSNVTAVNTTLSGNITANSGNIVADFRVGGNTTTIGTSFSAAANVSGNVTSGNVTTGILAANTANITGNITSGNANLGNLATANFFSGDGSLLTNIATPGIARYSYSYTDPNPLNLNIIPTGNVVTLVQVVVVTPFTDSTATISMGDTTANNNLLTTSEINTQVNGTFTAYPAKQYGADTQLVLAITPGTSTAGSGVVVINFQ